MAHRPDSGLGLKCVKVFPSRSTAKRGDVSFEHHTDISTISSRGDARAEDAEGTPTQSHISPSILVKSH